MKSSHLLGSEKSHGYFRTPLGFTAFNKATFAEKVLNQSRLPKSMTKRQKKGTFCVNISSELSPIRQI